jgi:hypothetical protein
MSEIVNKFTKALETLVISETPLTQRVADLYLDVFNQDFTNSELDETTLAKVNEFKAWLEEGDGLTPHERLANLEAEEVAQKLRLFVHLAMSVISRSGERT